MLIPALLFFLLAGLNVYGIVKDAYGNSNSCIQSVEVNNRTVNLTDPPGEVGGPVPKTAMVQCLPNVTTPMLPVVKDAAGAILQPIGPIISETGDECEGTVTYSYQYVDLEGQRYVWTFTYFVKDNIPPSFAVPEDIDIPSRNGIYYADPEITGWPSGIIDNCSTVFTMSYSDEFYTIPVQGIALIKRRWIVADECGNTNFSTQYITITDFQPIVANCQDITVQLDNEGIVTIAEDAVNNGSTDASGSLTFDTDKTTFTCPNIGVNTVLLTVTSINGNTATCSSSVTVLDNTPPEIFCVGNQTVIMTEGSLTYSRNDNEWNATASDNCGVASLFYSMTGATIGTGTTLNGKSFNKGVTTIAWIASDGSGNSATCTQSVTVKPAYDLYCTLNMGFYGNSRGLYCNETKTLDLINKLLKTSDLKVGYGSNTYTIQTGQGQCVIDILPGSGKPLALNGTFTCSDLISSRSGRLNNSLLGQTITLGLNLRLDPELSNLTISPYYDLIERKYKFWTSQSSGCKNLQGEAEPNGDWIPYFLPKSLLTGKKVNVGELYGIANLALGGAKVGVPPGDLVKTLEAVNEGFEKCAFLRTTPPPLTIVEVQAEAKAAGISDFVPSFLKVYSGRLNHVITFEFVPECGGYAVLDIYNILGQKVATLIDRTVEESVLTKVEYMPQEQESGVLFYRLMLGKSVTSGKIIYMNDYPSGIFK
jgi:hypothetical protein